MLLFFALLVISIPSFIGAEFEEFPSNCQNEVLTKVGFQKIFKQIFPQGDPSDFSNFVFKWFDNDDNKDEAMRARGTLEDKLGWAFKIYDLDSDGQITRQEMELIVGSVYKMLGDIKLPEEASTPAKRIDQILATMDLNRDAQLTLEEFIQGTKSDPNILLAINLLEGLFYANCK